MERQINWRHVVRILYNIKDTEIYYVEMKVSNRDNQDKFKLEYTKLIFWKEKGL